MKSKHTKLITAAVVGCSALWAVQGAAAQTGQSNTAEMQNQIDQLQTQVHQLKNKVDAQKTNEESASDSSSKPKDPLTIGGGLIFEHAIKDQSAGQRPGGVAKLDYFEINVHGKTGQFSYGAEERLGNSANIGGNHRFLHYGWGAYNFGYNDSSQIKVGLFQVPFGNLTFGYDSFYGNLTYYAGFTDNQSAGVGYKYEDNGLRFDLDYFRNEDLGSQATYNAATTNRNYSLNVANTRLAYTFNQGEDNNVQFSAAVKGGQLDMGGGSDPLGSQFAGTVAMNANVAKFNVKAQFVDYKYNIPQGSVADRGTINKKLYGFAVSVPASGRIYSASIKRPFDVNLGPINTIALYDDYSYLHRGDSAHPEYGNMQFNVAGIEAVAGPFYAWAELITGKNSAATTFRGGPGDQTFNHSWNTAYNLAIGYYFSGTFSTD